MSDRNRSVSYEQHHMWKVYDGYFPEHYRADPGEWPEEEWAEALGACIHIDRWRAQESPLTVFAIHGAASYSRALAPYLRAIWRAGYEVVAPDLPGYGLTAAPRELVDYQRWPDVVFELVKEEQELRPGPIVLFGFSVGGLTAYEVALRLRAAGYPVAAVIATTLADPRKLRVQRKLARFDLLGATGKVMLPLMARRAGNLPLPITLLSRVRSMSNNRALSALMANDRLGGNAVVPLRFISSLYTFVPSVEPEDFRVCPVLLVHPEEDRWFDVASSRLFYDYVSARKRLVLLKNCGHFPIEEPGIDQMTDAITTLLGNVARGRAAIEVSAGDRPHV